MSNILKESQETSSTHVEDETAKKIKSTRKRKPKWIVKEVPSFYGNPNKWVNRKKTRDPLWSKQDPKL